VSQGRPATNAVRRFRARRSRRGFTPLEELLVVAAVLGCFVYPLSIAARALGAQLAGEMDSAHRALLTQPR
jgi:hypothetical protein